jgi:hypothetical protein
MISFHMAKDPSARVYRDGFKAADTNELARIARCVAEYTWSPCIWREGIRRQDKFSRADWAVLDFDNGEMTLAQACQGFCDMIHIIGTTKSHQVQKGGISCDRFRVLLKFSNPIVNIRDYRYTMSKLIAKYPADPAPKDGARFFFPCKEIVQSAAEGYTEDVQPAPDWFENVNPKRLAGHRRTSVMPTFARNALLSAVPVGRRNTTWYRLGKDLAKVGMDFDEIFSRIVSSPTYGGKINPDLGQEIGQAVRNGIVAAERELTT